MSTDRVVRKTLADGSVREYRYARKGVSVAERTERRVPYAGGTLGQLLKDYEDSPEWRKLSASTKSLRHIYLRPLVDAHHLKLEEVEKRHLVKTRNVLDKDSGPGAANQFVRSVRIVWNWGLKNGITNVANPASLIDMLPETPLPTFTAEQIAEAERRLPEPLRRVMVLGRYTLQRRSDLCAMTWANYDGRMIRLTQQKTGVGIAFEVHDELKAELDRWKAELGGNVVSLSGADPLAGLTILTNFVGKPWLPRTLSRDMREHLERIGLREKGQPGLNVHGLRKRGATWLAEEGSSAHEIMSVTGHKTLAMAQKYTEMANREKLATGVFRRLSKQSAKN